MHGRSLSPPSQRPRRPMIAPSSASSSAGAAAVAVSTGGSRAHRAAETLKKTAAESASAKLGPGARQNDNDCDGKNKVKTGEGFKNNARNNECNNNHHLSKQPQNSNRSTSTASTFLMDDDGGSISSSSLSFWSMAERSRSSSPSQQLLSDPSTSTSASASASSTGGGTTTMDEDRFNSSLTLTDLFPRDYASHTAAAGGTRADSSSSSSRSFLEQQQQQQQHSSNNNNSRRISTVGPLPNDLLTRLDRDAASASASASSASFSYAASSLSTLSSSFSYYGNNHHHAHPPPPHHQPRASTSSAYPPRRRRPRRRRRTSGGGTSAGGAPTPSGDEYGSSSLLRSSSSALASDDMNDYSYGVAGDIDDSTSILSRQTHPVLGDEDDDAFVGDRASEESRIMTSPPDASSSSSSGAHHRRHDPSCAAAAVASSLAAGALHHGMQAASTGALPAASTATASTSLPSTADDDEKEVQGGVSAPFSSSFSSSSTTQRRPRTTTQQWQHSSEPTLLRDDRRDQPPLFSRPDKSQVSRQAPQAQQQQATQRHGEGEGPRRGRGGGGIGQQGRDEQQQGSSSSSSSSSRSASLTILEYLQNRPGRNNRATGWRNSTSYTEGMNLSSSSSLPSSFMVPPNEASPSTGGGPMGEENRSGGRRRQRPQLHDGINGGTTRSAEGHHPHHRPRGRQRHRGSYTDGMNHDALLASIQSSLHATADDDDDDDSIDGNDQRHRVIDTTNLPRDQELGRAFVSEARRFTTGRGACDRAYRRDPSPTPVQRLVYGQSRRSSPGPPMRRWWTAVEEPEGRSGASPPLLAGLQQTNDVADGLLTSTSTSASAPDGDETMPSSSDGSATIVTGNIFGGDGAADSDVSRSSLLSSPSRGETELYRAVSSGQPEDVIAAILASDPSQASIVNGCGWVPLHCAIERYDTPLSVLRRLVEADPSTAAMRGEPDDFGGGSGEATPVDLLWKRFVRPEPYRSDDAKGAAARFRRYMEEAVGDLDGGWETTLRRDDDEVDRKARAECLVSTCGDFRVFWDLMVTFVAAAHEGTLSDRRGTEGAVGSDIQWPRLVHAAICIRCDPLLVRFASALCPEQLRRREGTMLQRLPLHVAAASLGTRSSSDSPTAASERIVRDLVRLHPPAASCLDGDGRLPLALALESGTRFEGGVRDLLRACPEALSTRDIRTHLLPFMVAAVGDNSCSLDCVYGLLRENPLDAARRALLH